MRSKAQWLVLGTCLIGYLVLAVHFALRQELWVDESTQLSGLTLAPLEAVKWLAGEDPSRFGVPGDRMPPLSYWLGWLWTKAFGLSENSLRMLGVTLIAGAFGLIVDAARRTLGVTAACVAGAWFALSPTAFTLGVEIRAYPFLIFFSALATWCSARLLANPKLGSRGWFAFGLACLAACYSHFFGLALTGGAMLAWLYSAWRGRAPWRPIFATGGLFAVAVLGLIPFVIASVVGDGQASAPSAEPAPDGLVLGSAARLGYRLLGGHPALGAYPALAVVAVLAAAWCVGCVMITWPKQHPFTQYLVVSVGSGLAASVTARLLSPRVDALLITYNAWMLPQLALIVGASVSDRSDATPSRRRWVTLAPALVAVSGVLLGSIILNTYASTYAHSAAERIESEVRAKNATNLFILHDEQGSWGHGYFPLYYLFGREVRQGLVASKPDRLEFTPLSDSKSIEQSMLAGATIALLSSRLNGFEQMRDHVRQGIEVPLVPDALLSRFESLGCKPETRKVFVAMIGTELVWLKCR